MIHRSCMYTALFQFLQLCLILLMKFLKPIFKLVVLYQAISMNEGGGMESKEERNKIVSMKGHLQK